jgi:integrase
MEEKIRSARPDISDQSIKTYVASFKKMRKSLGLDDSEDIKFLDDHVKVLKCIDDFDNICRKTNIIIALIVVMKAYNLDPKLIGYYSEKLSELNKKYRAIQEKQEMTPKQRKNWVSYTDIIILSNDILKQIIKFKDNENLIPDQYKLLQDEVLLRSYLISPARNAYGNMKVVTEQEYNSITNKHDQNYLILNQNNLPIKFIFYEYKTYKTHGPRSVNIDVDTAKIIKLWLKHNKSGWFISNKNNEPIGSKDLTRYLQTLFKKHLDKNVASTMLRHIITTHRLQGQPTLKQQQKAEEDIINKFQHTGYQHQLYRKVS